NAGGRRSADGVLLRQRLPERADRAAAGGAQRRPDYDHNNHRRGHPVPRRPNQHRRQPEVSAPRTAQAADDEERTTVPRLGVAAPGARAVGFLLEPGLRVRQYQRQHQDLGQGNPPRDPGSGAGAVQRRRDPRFEGTAGPAGILHRDAHHDLAGGAARQDKPRRERDRGQHRVVPGGGRIRQLSIAVRQLYAGQHQPVRRRRIADPQRAGRLPVPELQHQLHGAVVPGHPARRGHAGVRQQNLPAELQPVGGRLHPDHDLSADRARLQEAGAVLAQGRAGGTGLLVSEHRNHGAESVYDLPNLALQRLHADLANYADDPPLHGG